MIPGYQSGQARVKLRKRAKGSRYIIASDRACNLTVDQLSIYYRAYKPASPTCHVADRERRGGRHGKTIPYIQERKYTPTQPNQIYVILMFFTTQSGRILTTCSPDSRSSVLRTDTRPPLYSGYVSKVNCFLHVQMSAY